MNQSANANDAVMHNNKGNALKQMGRLEEALASYEQAQRCNPQVVVIFLNLANTARLLGRLEKAAAHARQAIQLDARVPEAYFELGAALHDLGHLPDAVAAFQQAVRLRASFPEAYNRLGLLALRLGQVAEAVNYHRHAVAINPAYVEAQFNLGNALRLQGKREEAAACYQQALRWEPQCAEAYYSLGGLFAELEDLDQAVAYFNRAINLKPDLAAAHGALGIALAEQGKIQDATATLEHALRLKPDQRLRVALATRLPVIYQSAADLLAWRSRLTEDLRQLVQQQFVKDITEEPALNFFYLAYQGHNDRDIMRDLARLYRAPAASIVRPKTAPAGKIRVGFLSTYFRSHTIGHWMRGLVAHLSRADFDVTVLSIGNPQDEVATLFKQHADRWLEVPRHLPSARRLIADQQLDVLCYADIGMEPFTYTLAFSRLAPVQCVTIGHPVTTGIDTIDYFLSTKNLESDESDQHYTEKLIRLDRLPFYYYRPTPLIETGTNAVLRDREHFGLGAAAHFYTCTQSLFKLHPEFDDTLAAVLRADPAGTLLLFQGWRPHWEEILRQRFALTMPDVLHRIRFLPRMSFEEYLKLVAASDVLLDTRHFGGGSTSFETLALGKPIVTMPSKLLRGRITFAMYKQMDVLDTIAQSPQHYVDIALRLANDADQRQAIRTKILESNSRLFENCEGIRELEQFFRRVVGR
jgi:predicted O-linked N-acetylglucosamine transferase (SPINDLY family)